MNPFHGQNYSISIVHKYSVLHQTLHVALFVHNLEGKQYKNNSFPLGILYEDHPLYIPLYIAQKFK